MKTIMPSAGVVLLLSLAVRPALAAPCAITEAELNRLCAAELEQLFAGGKVGAMPVGPVRGRVLLVTSAPNPRLRAQLMNAVWKGKVFCPDGSFTNQWLGFQAVPSHAIIAPSWFDDQPCFVLEYPPGSPVFANTRDEFREIAPGLFLGRFYQRCPCPKLQGYFVLWCEPACK